MFANLGVTFEVGELQSFASAVGDSKLADGARVRNVTRLGTSSGGLTDDLSLETDDVIMGWQRPVAAPEMAALDAVKEDGQECTGPCEELAQLQLRLLDPSWERRHGAVLGLQV